MFLYITILFSALTSVSYAGPEPCEKFDGAKYDECVDGLYKDDSVQITEEDVRNSGEAECRSKTDSNAVKKCVADASRNARISAKERKQQQESGALAKTVAQQSAKPRCESDAILERCTKAKAKAEDAIQDLTTGDLIRAASAAVIDCKIVCAKVAPSSSIRLATCTSVEIKRIENRMGWAHSTCEVAGGKLANNASKSTGAREAMAKAHEDGLSRIEYKEDILGNGPGYCGYDGTTYKCHLANGEVESHKYDSSVDYADKKKWDDLYSGGGDEVERSNYHNTRCVTLSSDYQACRIVSRGADEPQIVYRDPDGKQYSDFGEMMLANRDRSGSPPIPMPRPEYVSGGSTSVSQPPHPYQPIPNTTGGAGVGPKPIVADTGNTNSSSSSNSSNGTNGASAGTANGQTGQASKNNSGSGSAGSGSGTGMGSSATSGGSFGYGGTSIALFPANGGGTATPVSFQGSSTRPGSNSIDDSVGGGGDSGGGWGDGGGPSGGSRFNATGSRDSRIASNSEGVNRDAGVMGASMLGGSRGAATVASAPRESGPSISSKGDLNTAAFQAGYHKAPPSVEKMTSAQKAALKEKIRRLGKNAKLTGCKDNDLQCFAAFFHKQSLKRLAYKKKSPFFQQRGIASMQSDLPKGVWRGYVDILSHMSKVHDRIDLNFEGEIEGGN